MLFTKQKVEQILQVLVWFNGYLGIWGIIIAAVFAFWVLMFLYLAYQKHNRKMTNWLLGGYAFIYLFSGWTIFQGRGFMGLSFSLFGTIAMWLISFLLILDIYFGWTFVKLPKTWTLRIISWFLIFSGIFLYPIIEVLLGFTYPRLAFFGAECPTTISLIGLLIGAVPKTNKILLIILSFNALVTGFGVAVNGAPFDYLYAMSGVLGLSVLILYSKYLFFNKK